MRRLVLSMFVSLDGYIEGPGGEFIGPEWSADLDAWTERMIERFDTLLYGRTAWQGMAEFWPQAEETAEIGPAQQSVARFMNGVRKIVFSRTLKSADAWANSSLATAGIEETVAAERGKPGKDMVIFAGAKFAQTALRAGVVDEIWLLTVPMLFGGGTRLFDGGYEQQKLKLLEAKAMDTGAVFTRYEKV
jgi:Dihydrofolate reductase